MCTDKRFPAVSISLITTLCGEHSSDVLDTMDTTRVISW